MPQPLSLLLQENCAQFVFACAAPFSFLSWTCYNEASVLNATHPPSATFLSLNPLFTLFSVLTPFSPKPSPQIVSPGPLKCHLPVFKGSRISCGHTEEPPVSPLQGFLMVLLTLSPKHHPLLRCIALTFLVAFLIPSRTYYLKNAWLVCACMI